MTWKDLGESLMLIAILAMGATVGAILVLAAANLVWQR